MNKLRRRIIESNEVSEVVECMAGGYPQKIMLEGRLASNPIVLVLHGGPGSPIPFSVGCRGLFPELTGQVMLVCWDQLGCGINNCGLDNKFSVESFVRMTEDIVRYLKTRFPDNRLLLFGTSWGSVLAARVSLSIPDLIDGVLVYGQIVKELFLSEEVYQAISASGAPEKTKREIVKMQSQSRGSMTIKDFSDVAGVVRKYTEGYQSKQSQPMPIGKYLSGMFSSPDYRLKDFIALFISGYRKNESLLNEMVRIDLSRELQSVTVPYRMIQGSSDIVTSTSRVLELVEQNENPNLSVRVIEKSGHIPSADGMQVCVEEIEKMIRALA